MEEEEDNGMPTAPFWMATFSDMVTLLLAFFVMIVAMSEVEVKKFEEALSYFSGGTGPMNHRAATPSRRMSPEEMTRRRTRSERYEKLLQYLKDNDLEDAVTVHLTDEGLHVIITDSVMFRSGEADLLEPSRRLLSKLSGILGSGGLEAVLVEGHTDDRPIRTPRFPSNWELSAARATSVVRYLLGQEHALDPARYTATGHAEHRPLAPNEDAARRARNRRVEILFEWGGAAEPAGASSPVPGSVDRPRLPTPISARAPRPSDGS
ncbi:MAG: flagellar motor protein MotB [Bacteroidota bacterium]